MLLGMLALLSAASPARADFNEWTLAVTPAYSVAYADSRTAHGGGLALDVGFGLTDALALHATGFVSWQQADATKTAQSGVLSGFAAMLGVIYTLDVIRLQPSFDLSVGAIGLRGDATYGFGAGAEKVLKPITGFGVSAGFALDYLLTRRFAVGVEVRYHAVLSDLNRLPTYLYAGPRVVFRFGGG
jgi:hypothetical protein